MADKTSTATIMCVDDTPDNLYLLQDMLLARGYRVLAFPNGRMALAAAVKNPPDLILLDINMPDMNGFEVCERLKADDALKKIPLLFISALSDTADKVKAFSAGAVDYVSKPFECEEVYARIHTHLELCRQRRKLQEAYDKLLELERLRDNLTHMVVHDMRSPLTAVAGSLELLRMQIPDDSEMLEVWQMGRRASQSLADMCNNLLDVSRLEAGQMPIQRETCDMPALVSDVVGATETQAAAALVAVCAEAEKVSASADKSLLRRILNNLLTNAIKNTPAGGRVTVRAAASADGRGVRVEVIDTGRGIPPECHGRIFEKFGQVERRQDEKRHSSGLGLTFCKLAVEAHGGSIGVDSEVGRGSVFWFTLPTPTPTPHQAVRGNVLQDD